MEKLIRRLVEETTWRAIKEIANQERQELYFP